MSTPQSGRPGPSDGTNQPGQFGANPYSGAGQQYGSTPPQDTGQYGGAPPSGGTPPKQRNTVGIIALIVAIVGAIFACIPGALIVGWVLLPIGFILGLVGLFMSGKPKRSAVAAVIISIIGTLVGFIVFFTVVGDAVDDAFNEDVSVSSSGSSEDQSASANEAAGEAAVGTRENPAGIGDTLSSEDWDVVINGFTRNATDQVMNANPFSDTPPAGSQYALVDVTATYTGDGSERVEFISFAFVTDSGNVIRPSDNFAVAPEPLEGELYAGASATGNKVIAVPDNASGLLRVGLDLFSGETFVTVE